MILFQGLPAGWQALFTVAFCVVVAMFAWTVVLFARSRSAHTPRSELDRSTSDAFSWVFLVPALNEETTIRDSVERLLAVPVAERHVVVIDDGSDDATPAILAELAHPDLHVLRRELPDARIGKAAGLNAAYRQVGDLIGDADRRHVVVVIVDADGRLHPDAPSHVAGHFLDERVGGVQSLVRIYNRRRVLTWLQDVEFGVYGHLFQNGRNDWGTAGMGGNGQFNRLAALDDIADDVGPWRDSLTEDQDLGLRLLVAGWRSRQEVRATIDQQGLSKLRPLLRQRTRWAQGGLQAFHLARPVAGSPFSVGARIELLAYLFMPIWQGITGAALIGAAVLTLTGEVPLWGDGALRHLALIYLLAFGGTVLGCVAAHRRRGVRGWLVGFVIGHAYALYTWMIWPVLLRAAARHVSRRQAWAKTGREPIEDAEELVPAP